MNSLTLSAPGCGRMSSSSRFGIELVLIRCKPVPALAFSADAVNPVTLHAF